MSTWPSSTPASARSPGLDETGKVINGPDLSVDAQVPGLTSLDAFGHGTHMASIIAGRDDNATTPGQYNNPQTFVGIAPNAGIVNVKVGSASGAVDVSQVIAGIDWVVTHAHSSGLNIKVLNLSFGTNSTQPYTLDPLDYAAEVAWHHGIVVVAAAGNDGSATTSLEDPADDPFVIAVGAENTDNGAVIHGPSVASFTNTGNPDRTVDVIAPGVHVLGLRDPGSYVDQTFPSAEVGTRFFRGSGTSQAAAVVSGAVALLAQKFPAATPDELKYLIDQTAAPLPGVSTLSQGHGVIQAGKAGAINQAQLTQMLNASPKGPTITPATERHVPAQPGHPTLGAVHRHRHPGRRPRRQLPDRPQRPSPARTTRRVGRRLQLRQPWPSAKPNGTSWSGATWNNEQLTGTGATPTLWDGTATGGVGSTNMRWSNMRWSGDGWANMRWADANWANMRWAGDGWS